MKIRIRIAALISVTAAIAFSSLVRAQRTAPVQEAQSSAEPGQSVWDGVYTQEQAGRGEALYAQKCARCHGQDLTGGEIAPALNSGEFKSNWSGLSVDALFERIKVSMPQDNPGSLSLQQTADAVAFVLFKNGFPAGKTELAREAEVVKQIRFEQNKSETAVNPADAISLLLSAKEDMVKAGSPVFVNVTMKNVSDHDVYYWKENTEDPGGSEYKLDVSDENSTRARETKFGRDLRGRYESAYLTPDTPLNGSGGWLILKPGAIVNNKMNVSKLYDLSHPEKYSIQVRRFDDETKSFVKSNKITVTVIP